METGERYTILQKLRETIYGEIYKGYDNKQACNVALKLSRTCQSLKRGEDPLGEIAILEHLSHASSHDGKQYVIHLHDKFSTKLQDVPYYCTALEYADSDLLDRIMELAAQRRQLSFSQIRRYFVMLAKGLSFIHKNGISHLDISLENILVTKTDELRICDFGQAERKRTIQDIDLRRGKPKYMSPEVYQIERYDGFKADVWSLGVVLWGMATGGLIYKKPSYSDQRFVLLTKGQEGLLRLLQLDEIDDLPMPLLNLLSKMLEVNVEQRYLIEDVLAHPWLNLSGESQKSAKIKTPSPQLEQKTLPSPLPTPHSPSTFSSSSFPSSSPSFTHKRSPSSPLPPSISASPIRPTRHAGIPFILPNTPTGKTVSPEMGFRFCSPQTKTRTVADMPCFAGVVKEEGEFVDVQLFEDQNPAGSSSALAKKQPNTVLDRSQTEPERPLTSAKVVTADNKEVRVRTFSFGA